MKKLLVLLALVASFVFAACTDIFFNPAVTHNGLVEKMDQLLASEQAFYSEYYKIQEGDDTTTLVNNYESFKVATEELDQFFNKAKFDQTQEVFKNEYNEYYKDAVATYVADAGQFVEMVKTDGFNLDAAEPHFEKIDAHGKAFIDVHNKLIKTVNLQADY